MADWSHGENVWREQHYGESVYDYDPEPEEQEPESDEPRHRVGIL